MKAGRINSCRIPGPHRQRGVVLLIALIILVAMTLAGIAMMRSVDTGSVIAGNVAFRQSTMNAGDAGTASGFNLLVSVANTANTADRTILGYSNGDPCANAPGATAANCAVGPNISLPGYKSTPIHACEVTQTCILASDYAWWKDDASWVGAPVTKVTDPNNPFGPPIATVSFLVHRMCQNGGNSGAAGQLCQTYVQPASGCSKSQLLPCQSKSLFYRVTARSLGPRNTATYSQMLVLIADQ